MLNNEQKYQLIFTACCAYMDVNPDKITEKTRKKPIPLTRQMIAYLINKNTSLVYKEIAEKIGWADHTMVNKAINKMKAYLRLQPEVREQVKGIATNIRDSNGIIIMQ
jgi:chromosomal replication initiation ATPase DnaA